MKPTKTVYTQNVGGQVGPANAQTRHRRRSHHAKKDMTMPGGRGKRSDTPRVSGAAREMSAEQRDEMLRIAEYIRSLREISGLSTDVIAERADSTYTTITRWNTEAITHQASLDRFLLKRILEALGSSPLELERHLAGQPLAANDEEKTLLVLFRMLARDFRTILLATVRLWVQHAPAQPATHEHLKRLSPGLSQPLDPQQMKREQAQGTKEAEDSEPDRSGDTKPHRKLGTDE